MPKSLKKLQKVVISQKFAKGFRSNSLCRILLNEINCKPEKWRNPKKNTKSLKFLTTEKSKTKKYTGARGMLE